MIHARYAPAAGMHPAASARTGRSSSARPISNQPGAARSGMAQRGTGPRRGRQPGPPPLTTSLALVGYASNYTTTHSGGICPAEADYFFSLCRRRRKLVRSSESKRASEQAAWCPSQREGAPFLRASPRINDSIKPAQVRRRRRRLATAPGSSSHNASECKRQCWGG